MSKQTNQSIILLKSEVTYGTDATPTGAANALLVTDADVSPLEGEYKARNLLDGFLGAKPEILAGKHVKCSFKVEMAGAGAAGTAPAYGPALLACGFAETIQAAVDVKYDPVSGSYGSATLYFFKDGTRHVLSGARGNVSIEFGAGEIPYFKFDFTGLYVDPSEVAMPVPTLSGFTAPIEGSNSNSPTFTLHGYAAIMKSLNFDIGNQVNYRNLVGAEEVTISDRQGSGSVSIEAPAVTTKDFFTLANSAALAPLQLVHGTAAGNIVQIDAPKIQIKAPSYGDDNGTVMLNMDLIPTPSTGDDELSITVK